MKEVTLKTGKGVLKNSNGVIVRRIDLPAGAHRFNEGYNVVEYPTFEDVLALDWPPMLDLSLSSESITADSSDSVDVTLSVTAERSEDWGTATLSVAGDSFDVDVSNGSATETITTTTTEESIEIEATHPDLQSATAMLTVQQP